MATKTTKVFDAGSPGFLYTVIVSLLTVLTGVFGVTFPGTGDQIAGDVVTSLNSFGIFALVGVVVSSIILPIWNARRTAGFTWKKLIDSRLTWIALLNIVLSVLAIFGLVFPDGIVEQIFAAAGARDWTAIIFIGVNVIFPTVVRWIKSKFGTTA